MYCFQDGTFMYMKAKNECDIFEEEVALKFYCRETQSVELFQQMEL